MLQEETAYNTEANEVIPYYSEFRRVIRVFFRRKLAVIGLFIILAMVITAILAPLLAPYDPYKIFLSKALHQPNPENLLGTDTVGRDVLSRIIYGTRTSLTIGILASFISLSIGVTLGLIAGYFGGVVYSIIMRFVDAWMSVPPLMTVMVISVLLGGGIVNVFLALGIGMIPIYCRVTCGQALSVRQNDYVLAARAMGASHLRLMLRHILPNCMAPIIIVTTVQLGIVILIEAGLSFLGFGINPPTAAWGSMVNEGYKYLLTNPILSIAPGMAIMLVVFGFNMMGDGLRDALDPRLRGTV